MIEKFLMDSNYKRLLSAVKNGVDCSVFGLNIGEKLALIQDSAFIFFVVDSIEKADSISTKLSALGRTCEILSENIDVLTSPFYSCEKTVSILQKIINGQIDALIITPNVLAGRFPSRERLSTTNIMVGDEIDLENFVKFLVSINYKRVELVANSGEFAIRGDVIDLYPVNSQPIRIFSEYDTVSAIKYYNPITMLTTTMTNEVCISSNHYYKVSVSNIEKMSSSTSRQKFIDILSKGTTDYSLIAFDQQINYSIFDFVQDGLIVFDEAKTIYDRLVDYIDEQNKRIKVLEKSTKIYATQKYSLEFALNFNQNLTKLGFHHISQNNRIFAPKKVFSIRTLAHINYSLNHNLLLRDVGSYAQKDFTIILCAGSNEGAIRLSKQLNDANIFHNVHARLPLCNRQSVNILSKAYPLDILLPEDKLLIISSDSIFGVKRKVARLKADFFDDDYPKKDDYVVHTVHGVGKCLGVETLNLGSNLRDYVVVLYRSNDKLYLPVENIRELSKYSGSDKEPALNKIGGVEFAKTKEKARLSAKKVAFDLIGLYRERMQQSGYEYPPDDALQEQFEREFGFVETIDQLKAIEDCKQDMYKGKIMDRLICGDVGYGKTEVALRIAFKTILAGKQVALLCPTTILSEQHFITAKSRFADFGVNVEVLNRLRSPAEVTAIKKAISTAKIDLICGTHKLLAKDIEFRNLGLLILDEEQKFGVSDKEKIKNLKNSINVLTLSATPIPRTLNMSLIGVRDISLIETPPIERVPTQVQVVEYSEYLIKSAIEKELARDGQVLIIFNRVETIYQFASMVESLVPSAIVGVAHGQMSERLLEREIMKLYSRQTQVLVATTLIENGVDLPNANTLIVINSDRLGLSQLYQLKGRVGRSDRQAYAYFTYDGKKTLTENAYKRLQAIGEFVELGSGFKIAMRDLEIRGAGALLGAEQSGHIEKIGYNMYVELLTNSIKELKGEPTAKLSNVRVETNLSAFLPHDYIASYSQRLSKYRDVSRIATVSGLEQFVSDTESVYGKMPTELTNLCKISLVKNLCDKINATKVIVKGICQIVFSSMDSMSQNILDAVKSRDTASLNLETEPTIVISSQSKDLILDDAIEFLTDCSMGAK